MGLGLELGLGLGDPARSRTAEWRRQSRYGKRAKMRWVALDKDLVRFSPSTALSLCHSIHHSLLLSTMLLRQLSKSERKEERRLRAKESKKRLDISVGRFFEHEAVLSGPYGASANFASIFRPKSFVQSSPSLRCYLFQRFR
jgi:hypothetical protein